VSFLDDPKYQGALKALSDQERLVLELYWGMQLEGQKTFEEVADLLGVAPAEVPELARRALYRMAAAFRDDSRSTRKARFWRRRGAPGPRRRRRSRVLAGALAALRLSRRKRPPAIPVDRPAARRTLRFFDPPEEPEPEGGVGVREPRRPKLPGLSGAAALALPHSDEPLPLGVTGPIDPFLLN